MYCTKCGFQNGTGSAFCVNCGTPLEANTGFTEENAPQLQYSGQEAYNTYQNSSNEQINFAGQNPVPRKSGKGLVIGIICGCAVLAVAAVLFLFVFTGSPLNGTWYCEERGTVIQFSDNNRAEIHSPSGAEYGEFQYQSDNKEGTITSDENEYDFSLEDGVLTVSLDGDAEFEKAANIDTEQAVMSAVYGIWSSEQSGEVFELTADGKAIRHNISGVTEGTFSYKVEKGEGVLTFGDEEINFTATYELLSLKDGAAYQKAEPGLDIDEFVSKYSNNILGLWYDKAGILGTMEFKSGEVFTMTTVGMAFDGTYTFDAAKGEGTLTISIGDQGQSVDFTLSNEELNVDGIIYTREVVEQQELSDLLEGIN